MSRTHIPLPSIVTFTHFWVSMPKSNVFRLIVSSYEVFANGVTGGRSQDLTTFGGTHQSQMERCR
jgi:hypothetical protein